MREVDMTTYLQNMCRATSLLVAIVSSTWIFGCDEPPDVIVKESSTFEYESVQHLAPLHPPQLPSGSVDAPGDDSSSALRVGVPRHRAPYATTSQRGGPKGVDVRLVGEVLDRMGRDHTFVSRRWPEARRELASGELDLLVSAPLPVDEPVRSTDAYGKYHRVLFALRSDRSPHLSFEFRRVFEGLDLPPSNEEFDVRWTPGPTARDVSLLLSPRRCFEHVVAGEVAFCSSDERRGRHVAERDSMPIAPVGPPIETRPRGVAVSPELDDAFVSSFNRTLDEMRRSGELADLRPNDLGEGAARLP